MHLLIFRFSAMGDVALLTPVLRAVAEQNPAVRLTLVTRTKFAPFFYGIPNLTLIEADFEGVHKNFKGLLALFRQLRQTGQYHYVVDAHQNLRSAILKRLFAWCGTPSVTLNKGRREKKALTRQKNKILNPLTHTVERYRHLFTQMGLKADIGQAPFMDISPTATGQAAALLEGNNIPLPKNETWLGIAPFAQHAQKMWDFNRFAPLLTHLYRYMPELRIFLFGGGAEEIEKLQQLHRQFPQTVIVAGALNLPAELALIRQLDLMLCMDSGNMHLAALSGVPVLSIWGATHPYAGFGPYGQREENVLQIPNEVLPCRPCSVFGNKPCFRGDVACLDWLSVEMVVQRLQRMLEES